jgi:hypothetical protein
MKVMFTTASSSVRHGHKTWMIQLTGLGYYVTLDKIA